MPSSRGSVRAFGVVFPPLPDEGPAVRRAFFVDEVPAFFVDAVPLFLPFPAVEDVDVAADRGGLESAVWEDCGAGLWSDNLPTVDRRAVPGGPRTVRHRP